MFKAATNKAERAVVIQTQRDHKEQFAQQIQELEDKLNAATNG